MLPLHVGGDLDELHVSAVDAHLKHCLSCFREFRELAAMRARLGVLAEERLPLGALDGFAEEVMARIAVGEPGPAAEPPRPARQQWFAPQRLAAAAALLIAALAGWRFTAGGEAGGAGLVQGTGTAIGLNVTQEPQRRMGEVPLAPRQALREGPSVPAELTRTVDDIPQATVERPSGLFGAPPVGQPILSQEQMQLLHVLPMPLQLIEAQGLRLDETDRPPRERER